MQAVVNADQIHTAATGEWSALVLKAGGEQLLLQLAVLALQRCQVLEGFPWLDWSRLALGQGLLSPLQALLQSLDRPAAAAESRFEGIKG